MGEVIHLCPRPDAREREAYDAFRASLQRAQSSGRLVDMRVAVEAFDAWMAVSRELENERGRR
ncbi:hypothetical protein [Methylobacterium nodulans]|uniref:Uncharacterized protein n=1 Tax=Methylobacterium nodulans (strain LMG 21967 / CNCM I-2342 / ORS 2060) TaxID=460265 RepID=B8INV7_METNO|nr:hypothetical protein [Methylobacterium nodulans]ACL58473.1 conserved hypothetical protein [Methylobacterium nodulans ORS 2060]